MKRGTYAAGAMMASLAAGPAFLASLAVAYWASERPGTYTLPTNIDGIGGGMIALFFTVPFGFVIAMIPNIVGSWFMHGLGIGNFAARLPVAWALAGAGAAGMPFVFIPELVGVYAPTDTAFALTGASCALIAHRFATWT